ncbi:MAG TPA: sodium transporter [Candidatus Marinimicrobia bacterium]|nr:sodium transporter [Candidatus Neomarinimicrobiota bacterium]
MYHYLENIDIVLLFLYFTAVLVIGLYYSNREKTPTEYFLAGRNVGWIAIGSSLFATNISSEHFIGLAGSGASTGLAVGHFEWLACFIVLLLGWVFVPFYLKSGVYTMPEFLERRFNKSSRMYLTTVSIVAYILTKISVTLFAGGLLLNQILGWNMITSAIVVVIITGIYTIAGGLSAVIYTELIQTVILIAGAIVLTLMGLHEVGGFQGLRAALPVDFFHMFKPSNHPDFPWTGIIFGAPILAVWYWCTDQVIVQRVLSARNIRHARSGAIFAGFLKILPVFILILPGMIALALFPGIKGDEAYIALIISNLLPAGIRGIVIASLLAALMSSLASTFNSSSTLITMDVYRQFRPQANGREIVLIGRLATTALVILGILWVPFIRSISNQLFIYLQSVQAYISPPIAAVFIIGLFSTRVNGRAAMTALISGGILGALRLVFEILSNKNLLHLGPLQWFAGMNYLHFAIFLFVISTLIMLIMSAFGAAPSREQLQNVTINGGKQGKSLGEKIELKKGTWDRLNVLFSIVLVLTILSLWGIFF